MAGKTRPLTLTVTDWSRSYVSGYSVLPCFQFLDKSTKEAVMKIGVAKVDITPKFPTKMSGYFDRFEDAAGTHDPLFIRVFYLSHQNTDCVIAISDLIGIDHLVSTEIRAQIKEKFSIPTSNIVIAATHTHQGPADISKNYNSPYPFFFINAAIDAITIAISTAKEATLRVATTDLSTISQNRRNISGPIEDQVTVLVASEESGTPIASVIAYACHPTILESNNLLYSADFPGTAIKYLEENIGGMGIYVQGACGDINPTWQAHEYQDVSFNGRVLGSAATRLALESEMLIQDRKSVHLSWNQDVPQKVLVGELIQNSKVLGLSEKLDLERRVMDKNSIETEIKTLQAQLEKDTSEALHRELTPRLMELWGMTTMFTTAGQIGDYSTDQLEVSAIRISPNFAVVALPGEFLVEIGLEIKRRSPYSNTLIICYANGYFDYFAHSSEYANHGYEIGRSRYAEGTTERIVDTAVKMLNATFNS